MLSENALSDDVRSTQCNDDFLIAPSRPHVIDQVTQTVPKKRSKSGLYSVQGKIGIFWCRKIGGKLCQLDSIIYLTHIYVRGQKILSMEPFMRLLVCECGYHRRLRVNTCAKVDGAQHPQGK